MTDVNPTLDRIAHGQDGGHGPHHHHEHAAHHYQKAAEHHRQAAEAHRMGDTTGASNHAFQAFGHGAHAQHHANESLKGYAVASANAGYGGGTGAGAGDAAAGTYGLRDATAANREYVVNTGSPSGTVPGDYELTESTTRDPAASSSGGMATNAPAGTSSGGVGSGVGTAVPASNNAAYRGGGSPPPQPGFPTDGSNVAAPTTNPDAAYTPNIGGAPGQRS